MTMEAVLVACVASLSLLTKLIDQFKTMASRRTPAVTSRSEGSKAQAAKQTREAVDVHHGSNYINQKQRMAHQSDRSSGSSNNSSRPGSTNVGTHVPATRTTLANYSRHPSGRTTSNYTQTQTAAGGRPLRPSSTTSSYSGHRGDVTRKVSETHDRSQIVAPYKGRPNRSSLGYSSSSRVRERSQREGDNNSRNIHETTHDHSNSTGYSYAWSPNPSSSYFRYSGDSLRNLRFSDSGYSGLST